MVDVLDVLWCPSFPEDIRYHPCKSMWGNIGDPLNRLLSMLGKTCQTCQTMSKPNWNEQSPVHVTNHSYHNSSPVCGWLYQPWPLKNDIILPPVQAKPQKVQRAKTVEAQGKKSTLITKRRCGITQVWIEMLVYKMQTHKERYIYIYIEWYR